MLRRSIISVASSAALGMVLPVGAQTQRIMRMGMLTNYPSSSLPATSFFSAKESKKWFHELQRLFGWEQGRNLIVEYRYWMGYPQKHYANAEELVSAQVDMIFVGSNLTLAAAYKATRTIPIVAQASGLVALGYAKSLAHPGGNVTGVDYSIDFEDKHFELLYTIRPGLKKIGLTEGCGFSRTSGTLAHAQASASKLGVSVVPLPEISEIADIEPMLAVAKREGVQALWLGRGTVVLTGEGAQRIQAWATENKVIASSANWHRGQLLLAFGPDYQYANRAAMSAIDRILRGAKPADIPIEQPTRFEVIINRKFAKAIGLTMPQEVMLRATEVIE